MSRLVVHDERFILYNISFVALHRRSALAKKMYFWEYVSESVDPSVNVVLLEDTAAVLGVGLAGKWVNITSRYVVNGGWLHLSLFWINVFI